MRGVRMCHDRVTVWHTLGGPARQPLAGLSAPSMARTSLHGCIRGLSRLGLPARPRRFRGGRSLCFGREAHAYFFFVGRCQPSISVWRARPTASVLSGTSEVMVEPAPVVAPSPIVTGATSEALEPMKALSPITVFDLLAPS